MELSKKMSFEIAYATLNALYQIGVRNEPIVRENDYLIIKAIVTKNEEQ